ncbi:MAG: alpha/beta hydrolase [Ruminococcaceae bacterium]|nr:alpha/beta hydrolase [Oscillospiraceae bacterium]
MKKTTKRVLAFLLASTFVFSAMTVGVFAIASYLNPNLGSGSTSTYMSVNSVDDFIDLIKTSGNAFANIEEPEKHNAANKDVAPTIIIPGISQSVSYLADENGNPAVNANGEELSGGLLIIDSAQLPGVLAGTVAGPLVTSLLMQADMGLSDAVYDTVTQLFAIQSSGVDGKATHNLQTYTYEYPISEMTQDDRDYFYRMIPMKDVVDEIGGEDNLYFFTFPLISDPFISAAKLNDYIQIVKEQTGKDKVNIVTISLGGTILTAYLELYKNTNYPDINKVLNVVSCLDGTDVMGDFYLRNFNLDDQFFFQEFLPMVMTEMNGYATLGHIINIALKIFPRSVIEAILTAAVDGIIDTLMINCPQFWAMIPKDRYDDVINKYSFIKNDPEYSRLYATLEHFQQARLNLKDNLVKLNKQGALVHNVCGYNLDYSSQDYCFFAAMKSSLTTNSDAIIDIDSTSLGATYAKAGEVLSEEYIATRDPKYISPDGSLDISTCLFPDNVWFFQGQHHEVGRNDVVLKLVAKLASEQINSTADMPDKFPQFNGNRNTKNITRWCFDDADKVFAEYAEDPSLYNAEDIEELRAVYEEAEEYLENTICEPTSAQALLERFEYALYRVGVGDAPADTSTDEALEIIAKFLDETIYGVFGADGFSDLNDSKVVIDVPVTF